MLALLAGPHPDDPASLSLPLGDPGAIDLRALTVHTVESDGLHAVHPELIAAQRRAAEVLGALGARVRPASLTHVSRTLEIWSAMVAAGNVVSGVPGPTFAELLGEEIGRAHV